MNIAHDLLVYREMLSVAMAQLYDANQRHKRLSEQHAALRDELRRYTASRVTDDDDRTERLPNSLA